MSNESRGSITVASNSVTEINRALRRVREELDGVQGLRGRAVVFDRLGVATPTAAGDAMPLGEGVRVIDRFGQLIHALGGT